MWRRGATRRALLDTARLIAARDGTADISLNAVAQEAGLSTTTVFAYFPTKNDLYVAIVADDLASLARDMRESYAFPKSPERTEEEPVAETPAEEPAAETTAMTEETTPEPRIFDQPETSSEVSAAPLIALVPQPDAKPEADAARAVTPPRADAWLERRLRVFEKSLADIETRMSATQRDSTKALSVAEENSKIFGARLDASEKRMADLSNDLSTRMSAAEKRVRDAQAELRQSLLNASMRIDELERVAQNVTGAAGYTPPQPLEPIPAEAPQPVPDTQPAKPLMAAADSYLSAARRAALTAAALADMEKKKPAGKTHRWLNRKSAMFAGVALLCFVVGAMISYAVGEHIGRSTPVRIVVPAGAVQHRTHVVKAADAAPLDRLTALANGGNARAELLIGLRYHKGEGVKADDREAASWIARAANARDPLAQYWMGEFYAHGNGVATDASQALVWYQAAAEQGNRQAMHDLGVAYAEGRGATQDFAQSAQWFAKAAALGLTNSQFNLAVLYERGEGMPQSLSSAYVWYAIAAASGDRESRERVEAIALQMNPADLTAAKRKAVAFRPASLDAVANLPSLPAA